MDDEAALLRGIRERPDDAAQRLVHADWLEEHGLSERAELVRVCEAMRSVPVFDDAYWQLKARRNELRPLCPAEWLAATGLDGSRYDPIYRDGIPDGWRDRWRLIREFTERWYLLPMGDVGGRAEEVAAVEHRLGRTLPPSVREYIAYAHDAARPGRFPLVHRDVYTMERIQGQPAISVMMIAEGNLQWAIHEADLDRDDPPVHTYVWPRGDETRYVPMEEGRVGSGPLTEFVLGFVAAYKPTAGNFFAPVARPETLIGELSSIFTVRLQRGQGWSWEGDGILIDLFPAQGRHPHILGVSVHERTTWQQVPELLRQYARLGNPRGGMFIPDEDRADMPGGLGPAPPPMGGPPSQGPETRGPDDIPF